jgi:hypothetical protein
MSHASLAPLRSQFVDRDRIDVFRLELVFASIQTTQLT